MDIVHWLGRLGECCNFGQGTGEEEGEEHREAALQEEGITQVGSQTTLQAPHPKVIPPENVRIYTAEELNISNLTVDHVIGEGATCKVMKTRVDDMDVVVKDLNFYHDNYQEVSEAECFSLARFDHRNIIKLLGVYDHAFVFPYYMNGNLKDHMERNSTTWEFRLQVLQQIGSALAYLHSNEVIFRDLKSDNILLDVDMRPILSDFGGAYDLNAPNSLVVYSKGYADPEYILTKEADKACDTYAFGIFMLEMLSGLYPGDNEDMNGLLDKARNEGVLTIQDEKLGSGASTHALIPLIDECLRKDRASRITMHQVVEEIEKVISN